MATSRLTFRDKSADVCWQKTLRDSYSAEGVPPVPHLDVGRAIVKPTSRKIAESIILKYEWLGTMASGVNRFYGIFFGDFCAGVTTFAPAGYNLPSLAKSLGVDGDKLAYLGRGANAHWSPKGANSKLIAWSLRYEEKDGRKIAVAFSDTDAGEIGTIYQACNWVYIGVGSIWNQWVSPLGKIWSFNRFTTWAKDNGISTSKGRKLLHDAGWIEQKTNPKHRYVYILDKKDKLLRDMVEKMRQPYPKRGAGETDNAPETNQETGGASPTAPLSMVTNGTPD